MERTPRIVVVTGANRGIGAEVVRQVAARGDTAVLGARDVAAGERAADAMSADRLAGEVWVRRLDVDDAATIAAVATGTRRPHPTAPAGSTRW